MPLAWVKRSFKLHLRTPSKKRAVIESFDGALSFDVKEILPDDQILLVVTADHSTPRTGRMIHSGDTVPITVRKKFARIDHVSEDSEVSCARSCLSLLRGPELMYLILNLMVRGKM